MLDNKNVSALNEEATGLLERGYQPYGDPCTVGTGAGYTTYLCQAFVKYEDIPDPEPEVIIAQPTSAIPDVEL